MALPPTELRYKKSALYFITGVFALIFIGLTFTIFFSDADSANPVVYIGYFASIIIMALTGFLMYKRYSSREPILIFRAEGLQVPGKNNRHIHWSDITEWKIRTYKSSNYLVIRTSQGKTRIDISWLDRSSKEVRQLMETYIRQPGPHLPHL